MDLTAILTMVAAGMPDRVLIGSLDEGLTSVDLQRLAAVLSSQVEASDASEVTYLAGNGPAFAVSLFAAAGTGRPFLPLNYRLSDAELTAIFDGSPSTFLVADNVERAARVAPHATIVSTSEVLAATSTVDRGDRLYIDGDSIAVLLMTSGTTSDPKRAVLRHRHLTAYLYGTSEFSSSNRSEAALVSVPPYHIAGIANLLSNLYMGRRIVYLERFEPKAWLELAESEGVTHAMVVPTMLSRIVREMAESLSKPPQSLRALSYGGSKIAQSTVTDALRLFPKTGFVNAYGLTETASSVSVLGPDDHRDALASDDLRVRARLGSVGKVLPHVSIEVHDELGMPVPAGTVGTIMVAGDQVGGEYLGRGSDSGTAWFSTRDLGYFDEDGYLFVIGRADDTIIRGGENIAPAEIEEVIMLHPEVVECAVAGLPDDEWGHRIAAFVVISRDATLTPEELQTFVRAKLRGSKTPDAIEFRTELPQTATGKILRRELVRSFGADKNQSRVPPTGGQPSILVD
ncbi:class I adenylate-forming enzyme family protein [Rhodococcus wratislaviensis]|uniref:Putative acid--CoA ligase n=1 Tax=Rhodococcus wratislaviensis NBRC 100605 TaxID=1219028 RepID=X0RCX9_RHOWR|nr:class I adenylate-forming enzyme family protein [Rhodococcus wratislaviensis]GAF48900.1 putative acid--CoA ligase [Rhodococcus wratislaviensis NBRC 100605]